jgi:subtilisin family serine protease
MFFRTLGTLFCVLSLLVTPQPPLSAAPLGADLASNPPMIAETIPLGAQRTIAIQLTNQSGSPQQLRLFEAEASSAALRSIPAKQRQVTLPNQSEKVDRQLTAALRDGGEQDMLIFLADQPDLSAAYSIRNWAARGDYVYRELYENAERSQAELRDWLRTRGVDFRPLWIANAVLVRGDQQLLNALAQRADVALLRANRLTSIEPHRAETDAVSGNCRINAEHICWNIDAVAADRVWRYFGIQGEGITVANLDSGVRFDHPALIAQYRGNQGDGSFDHNYTWFHASGNTQQPADAGDHGSHTMGTMVARSDGTAEQPAVGVAPGARWMAARACSRMSCSEADLIAGAQWLLAPTRLDGSDPRPDLRPQIVNNSWAVSAGGDSSYTGFVAAWRAAGMFPVFVSGNNGFIDGCSSVQSPGDYPNGITVGALTLESQLANFSAIGPTNEGQLKPDLTAPGERIVSTFASGRQPNFGSLNGTSMAAPHVAGTVALLWAANPQLIGDFEATYAALTQSADPRTGDERFSGDDFALCKTVTVPNNVYGYGALDSYAAVAAARVDIPWMQLATATLAEIADGASIATTITFDASRVPGPGRYRTRVLVHTADLSQTPLEIPVQLTVPGDPTHATISGRVMSAARGDGLAATINVQDGPSVSSDQSGAFTLTLPTTSASYTVTARAPSYAPQTKPISVSSGANTTLDFALWYDLPQIRASPESLSATLDYAETRDLVLDISNKGTQPLSYTLSFTPTSYLVQRSDEGEVAAEWIVPPADAVALDLSDDGSSAPTPIGFRFPFYDQRYQAIHIGANGVLSFRTPLQTPTYVSSCFPVPETSGGAIVPLRVDLNPAVAGSRITYATIERGFLVSYEDVPLYADNAQRFNFQALLERDGTIRFNYRTVGAMRPDEQAVTGLQRSRQDIFSLGCRNDARLSSGLSIVLQPQVNSAYWLDLPQPSGLVAPGASVAVPVRLRWVPTEADTVLHATIAIRTNDTTQPQLTIPVAIRTGLAPYRLWLMIAR